NIKGLFLQKYINMTYKLFLLIALAVSLTQCNQKILIKEQKTFQNFNHKNIKIYESDIHSVGPCEPSIYINPVNPENIVVGSVINFYHYSFDGGKTWETDRLSSSLGVWGDPCVVSDNEGD